MKRAGFKEGTAFKLCALIFVFSLNAEIIDVLDAETGDFSQWRNPDGGGSSKHSIIQNPTCRGKYAFKWTHSGGRSESASNKYPRDKELWFGWAMYLPSDYPLNIQTSKPNQGGSVFQFHGHPCKPEPIAMFRIRQGKLNVWLKNMGKVSGVYQGVMTPVKKQWMFFMLNANFTHSGNGFFDFYHNGKKIFSKPGPNWVPCNLGPYFKMGTYANTPGGVSIYGDEIRVGTTREEVDPTRYCTGFTPVLPRVPFSPASTFPEKNRDNLRILPRGSGFSVTVAAAASTARIVCADLRGKTGFSTRIAPHRTLDLPVRGTGVRIIAVSAGPARLIRTAVSP